MAGSLSGVGEKERLMDDAQRNEVTGRGFVELDEDDLDAATGGGVTQPMPQVQRLDPIQWDAPEVKIDLKLRTFGSGDSPSPADEGRGTRAVTRRGKLCWRFGA
jgi:hypothetical protein